MLELLQPAAVAVATVAEATATAVATSAAATVAAAAMATVAAPPVAAASVAAVAAASVAAVAAAMQLLHGIAAAADAAVGCCCCSCCCCHCQKVTAYYHGTVIARIRAISYEGTMSKQSNRLYWCLMQFETRSRPVITSILLEFYLVSNK